ncbi:MAG: glycosyltransferase family 4 protein, partial [Desulfomonilaceae bacterium]
PPATTTKNSCRKKSTASEAMGNTRKILHLITSLNPGGIERWVMQMIEHGPRYGIQSDVCCKAERGRWANDAERLGAKVFVNRLTPLHVSYGKTLRRLIVDQNYSVVHCHLGTYSGYPIWLAHKSCVPIVNTFHNTRFPPQTSWLKLPLVRSLRAVYSYVSIRYASSLADANVAVSEGVVTEVIGKPDRRRHPVYVVRHGVDIPQEPDEAARRSFRVKMDFPEASVLFLHVGRFGRAKNHRHALVVFAEVSKAHPEVRMLFVGHGPLYAKIRQEADDLGLSDKVRFLGLRDDVRELMTMCDIFLFPSLYEGLGIVALEAAAAGLPVVGYRIPGLSEVVIDNKTGFLAPCGDVRAMVDAVDSLVADASLRKELGRCGRRWVQEHFSTEKMIQRYAAIYEEVARKSEVLSR